MVSFTYLLALFTASAALATPVSLLNEDSTVEIRQSGQVYSCKSGAKNDGTAYGDIAYDRAIGYFRAAKTTKGASGYPKPFDNKGNVMTFASGCGSNVWELPVLANGKAYDYNSKKGGNSPGPMRVYYTKDLKFCGIGAKEKADGSGNPHNCVLR